MNNAGPLFSILLFLWPAGMLAQQCSTANANLVSEQSVNKFSCGGPFGANGIAQVSITDNYSLSCIDTNTNNQYFSDSSSVTGHGECFTCPTGCPPGSPNANTRCNPTMEMIVHQATDASGVGSAGNNQFFNNATDHFICTGVNCLGATGCGTGNQFQDFHQCAGVACAMGPPAPCDAPPPDEQFTVNNPNDPTDCEPLILDLTGEGFHLTDTAHGVVFDIRADRRPLRIPWTADSRNGFLVLDRNGNGVIDNGSEMFGNITPQPFEGPRNGFLALAQFDKPENGGNGDGVIDSQDAVFSQLRIWVDANHDGISQPEELHTLPEMGVFSISLDYSLSRRTDQFGNVFRYKAKINQGVSGEPGVGKSIYDVFFVTK